MTTDAMVRQIAHGRGLCVGLVYDPDAQPSECWVASLGLDAQGAGGYPSAALGAALLDLDGEAGDPSAALDRTCLGWLFA